MRNRFSNYLVPNPVRVHHCTLLHNLSLVPLDLPRDGIPESQGASRGSHPVETITAVYLEAVRWQVLRLWPIGLTATAQMKMRE